jgi:DNA-binding NtrC family response regulator
MCEAGEFREDLYYRLNVVTLSLPPLRERPTDIRLLARIFLEEACEEHSLGERSFSEGALKQLEAYAWPGNIRELKNRVERTAILSEDKVIDVIEDLPAPVEGGPTPPRSAAESPRDSRPADSGAGKPAATGGEFAFTCNVEAWQEFHEDAGRSYLKYVLRKAGGNVSEAARLLCLERAYLHRLMKKLGVQRDVVVPD